MDKLDFIKTKNFCASKDPTRNWKTNHRMVENISKSYILIQMYYVDYIFKTLTTQQ